MKWDIEDRLQEVIATCNEFSIVLFTSEPYEIWILQHAANEHGQRCTAEEMKRAEAMLKEDPELFLITYAIL